MACSGNSALIPCGAPYPDTYCCPSASRCMPVFSSDGTTVANATICCPLGSDCASIQTITCDITQYNATLHPFNQIHAEPDMALETCGNECCPSGYVCLVSQTCSLARGAREALSMTSVTPRIPTSSVGISSATAITSQTPLPSPPAPKSPSGGNNILLVAVGSTLCGVFVISLIVGFLLVRRYGFPFRRRGAKERVRKEKKISWNKPELEDTQKRAVYAELDSARSIAHELRASRDAHELPS